MNRLPLLTLTSLLLTAGAPAQILITTDATSDMVVAFNPYDGSLVNPALFAIPNTVQVSAIDVNGEIWISEQTGDRITRRDSTGVVLGTIGPTFTGGGLDNIRGIAYVGGLIYVTNAGTANGAPGNAIVVFDPAGNFVQSFSVNTLATSPFAVLGFQGDILVSGFSNNKDIYRFSLNGTPISVFHDSATISPAHGLARARDGNVWCVGFTTANICKLDATTGNVLSSFAAPSTPRGVYELGNGNVMWTNGSGVNIYDVTTQQSTNVFSGACYHINLYGGPSAAATAYGTGCDGLTLAASGLPVLGNNGFGMVATGVPAISPVVLFGFGAVAVNPGIDLTPVGMAGCFGYTDLSIGLFGGTPVVGASSTMSFAIPSTATLAGTAFSSQGLSFSLTTSLGLASSNGVSLVLGF